MVSAGLVKVCKKAQDLEHQSPAWIIVLVFANLFNNYLLNNIQSIVKSIN